MTKNIHFADRSQFSSDSKSFQGIYYIMCTCIWPCIYIEFINIIIIYYYYYIVPVRMVYTLFSEYSLAVSSTDGPIIIQEGEEGESFTSLWLGPNSPRIFNILAVRHWLSQPQSPEKVSIIAWWRYDKSPLTDKSSGSQNSCRLNTVVFILQPVCDGYWTIAVVSMQ